MKSNTILAWHQLLLKIMKAFLILLAHPIRRAHNARNEDNEKFRDRLSLEIDIFVFE